MRPYEPKNLPLDCIDWTAHVPLIGQDSAIRILNVLRKSGFLKDLRPGSGRRAAVMIFPELIEITEGER